MQLFAICSFLHEEIIDNPKNETFIQNIENAMGEEFEYVHSLENYHADKNQLLYVRTGGAEGIFLSEIYQKGHLNANSIVTILTSGQSNSLAASMEILSFLRLKNIPGRIIHGSIEKIASELKATNKEIPGSIIKKLRKNSRPLESVRLGVIGAPSDWLISSDVSYKTAEEVLGCTLVDLPLEEVETEFQKGTYVLPENIKLNPVNKPKWGKSITEEDFEKALGVYGAIQRIREKNKIDGLTIRCFNLLTSIKSTGCLSLAIFNSTGVPAACESDIPALLSMAVAKVVTGQSGFQVNLSKTDGVNMLFAHCTVPFTMVKDYVYDTHFESGIGVAVHGSLPLGPATVFKVGADLKQYVAEDVEIVDNPYENNLCRTQIIVKSTTLTDYMLNNPLGNHHIILLGHHAEELDRILG